MEPEICDGSSDAFHGNWGQSGIWGKILRSRKAVQMPVNSETAALELLHAPGDVPLAS